VPVSLVFDTRVLRGNDADFRVSGELKRCRDHQFSDKRFSTFLLGSAEAVE
jgi:hypothetical protein